jgi:uncharacterized membrane protein YraQ (UPF0718 family)
MEAILNIYSYFQYLFENTYTKKIVKTFVDLFLQLWPFILSGIFITTVLTLYFPKEKIAGLFKKHTLLSIVVSVCAGAVSPIGTYALIPLMGMLLRTGAFPVAPLVAFMISSPLINPFLFLLTAGAFGLPMAMLRVSASIVLGLVGGLLAYRFWHRAGDTPVEMGGYNQDLGTNDKASLSAFWKELSSQSRFILKVFSLALLTAAVVSVVVPADVIGKILGGKSNLSVIIAVAAGIPLYACGGGSIPVIEVLYDMGMSKGAVLGFFISGPATKASTLAALFACIERRIVMLYFAVTVTGALLFGIIYNLF